MGPAEHSAPAASATAPASAPVTVPASAPSPKAALDGVACLSREEQQKSLRGLSNDVASMGVRQQAAAALKLKMRELLMPTHLGLLAHPAHPETAESEAGVRGRF